MKTQIITACTALLCVLPAIPVFAQGELEPPGPPQPMMKTPLASIDARLSLMRSQSRGRVMIISCLPCSQLSLP